MGRSPCSSRSGRLDRLSLRHTVGGTGAARQPDREGLCAGTEQWTVGDTIAHPIRRTVTETDNLLFTAMTHNPQPLHLDAEAAAASEFGQILVNGTFTFALMIGLSVGETTLGTLVANLGYDKVMMPKPVFIGDTLRCETEVTELRQSRSRPHAGIVTFGHRLINQREEIVRSEEHTSELQSLMRISYAVFCLKKKTYPLISNITYL